MDSNYLHSQISVATTTKYDLDTTTGSLRAALATQAIKAASELGMLVHVVDGGSSHDFLQGIEAYANVHVDTSLTMGASRRAAIRYASDSGRSYVTWAEPEKVGYIHSIRDTALRIFWGDAQFSVPARLSMQSYPTSQQHAESFGNQFWFELTGTRLDMWFGPRTWDVDMSGYFLGYDGRFGGDLWESIFVPVLWAVMDGKAVASVPVDYTHPTNQTQQEESDPVFTVKRLAQLDNVMYALKRAYDAKTG